MQIAVLRMIHCLLSAAFTQWYSSRLNDENEFELAQQMNMNAIIHWVRTLLLRAWNEWRDKAWEATHSVPRFDDQLWNKTVENLRKHIAELELELANEQDERERTMQEAVEETSRLAEALASLETLYDSERLRLVEEDSQLRRQLQASQLQHKEAEDRATSLDNPAIANLQQQIADLQVLLAVAEDEKHENRLRAVEYQRQLVSLEENFEAETKLTEQEILELRRQLAIQSSYGADSRIGEVEQRLYLERQRSAAIIMWATTMARDSQISHMHRMTQMWRSKTLNNAAASLSRTTRSGTPRGEGFLTQEPEEISRAEFSGMRWEWENNSHTWQELAADVCVKLEEAERSRLGRIQLVASLGSKHPKECIFLLNQRKVVVQDSRKQYLLRRRQPKLRPPTPVGADDSGSDNDF